MKKLLFLIDSLQGGGAEKALQNLLNRLDPAEFHLTVMTIQPSDVSGLKPHIRCRCLNPRGSRVFGLWLRLCAHLGWAYPLYIRGGYDLEIAYLECYPTKLLAPSPGPKIAWVHCDMASKPGKEKMKRWYESFDRAVCVSRDAQTSFRQYFPARTAVLPNVVESGEILKKTKRFQGESFDFLAVGRLSPEKGFDRLISACAVLQQAGYEFSMGILGDGPERTALEKQAEKLKNIIFLGFQSNPYPYMAAANTIVIPSRSEGRSTVALEGMILGKAMVSTDCAGMREVLGDCALITDDLAFGMQKCLTEPEFRRRLEEKARLRGAALSDVEAARQTAALFREVLGERGKL